jgi:hypothetical protein
MKADQRQRVRSHSALFRDWAQRDWAQRDWAQRDRAQRGRAQRGRAQRGAYGGVAVLASIGIGLGGCCGDGKREMEQMADKYHDQAFACCKAIAEIDPPAAVSCFDSVKEWRLETGTLIIQWYQACRDGNEDLAQSLLDILRGMTSQLPGGQCPQTTELADGRKWSAGVPFVTTDTIWLSGRLVDVGSGEFGTLFPPPLSGGDASDRRMRLALQGGTFELDALGVDFGGDIAGEIELAPGSGNLAEGSMRVSNASLRWSLGNMGVNMRLVDPEGLSGVQLADPQMSGGHAWLEMRMTVEPDAGLGILVPSIAWVRIPLNVAPDRTDIVRGPVPATLIFPPSPGIADWNGDTYVDELDWSAFWSSQPIAGVDPRDVNIDGVFDDEDVRRFVAAWRDRYGS